MRPRRPRPSRAALELRRIASTGRGRVTAGGSRGEPVAPGLADQCELADDGPQAAAEPGGDLGVGMAFHLRERDPAARSRRRAPSSRTRHCSASRAANSGVGSRQTNRSNAPRRDPGPPASLPRPGRRPASSALVLHLVDGLSGSDGHQHAATGRRGLRAGGTARPPPRRRSCSKALERDVLLVGRARRAPFSRSRASRISVSKYRRQNSRAAASSPAFRGPIQRVTDPSPSEVTSHPLPGVAPGYLRS